MSVEVIEVDKDTPVEIIVDQEGPPGRPGPSTPPAIDGGAPDSVYDEDAP